MNKLTQYVNHHRHSSLFPLHQSRNAVKDVILFYFFTAQQILVFFCCGSMTYLQLQLLVQAPEDTL